MSGEVYFNNKIYSTSANEAYCAQKQNRLYDADDELIFNFNDDDTTQENNNGYIDENQTYTKNELTGAFVAAANLIPEKTTWTQRELENVLFVNYIAGITDYSTQIILTQDLNDGIISSGFNWIKEHTGWGVSRSDAVSAIDSQNLVVTKLLNEIKNGNGGEGFEDKFKEITGFELNQEAFLDCIENEAYITVVNNAYQKINTLTNNMKDCQDFDQAFEVLMEYYSGNEELALKALNGMVDNYMYGYCLYDYDIQVIKDSSGHIALTGETTDGMMVDNFMYTVCEVFRNEYFVDEFSQNFENTLGFSIEECYENYALSYAHAFSNIEQVQETQKLVESIRNCSDMEEVLTLMCEEYDYDIDNALRHVNNALNMASDGAFKIYLDGNGDFQITTPNGDKFLYECENVFDDDDVMEFSNQYLIDNYEERSTLKSLNAKDTAQTYSNSQESAIKRGAQVLQIGGLTLVVVGGVASVVGFPEAGIPMLSAGQKLAVGGMFADNVLQTVDTLSSGQTSQQKLNEMRAVGKETFTEAALLASGMAIGKYSSSINSLVTSNTGSKALGLLAEVGVDGTLSLAADFVITGELDIGQEGFNQVLNVLTGIATVKNLEYQRSLIQEIDPNRYEILRSNDVSINDLRIADGFMEDGFNILVVKQLLELDYASQTRARNLLNDGFNQFYIADAINLDATQYARLEYLTDIGVNDCYITKLASLDSNSYDAALELLSTTELNTASILDIVSYEPELRQDIITKYENGELYRNEINEYTLNKLYEQAQWLNTYSSENIAEVDGIINEIFGDFDVSARAKNTQSILSKLISNYESGGLNGNSTYRSFATDVVEDAFGTRIIIQPSNTLVPYTDDIDIVAIKTEQMQPTVDKLCEAIRNGEIKLTTLNNYGDEVTSYFTNDQVMQIARAYADAKAEFGWQEPLTIVSSSLSQDMFKSLNSETINANGETIESYAINVSDKAAVKNSGYCAVQFNADYGMDCLGETQLRGSLVDAFAEKEHVIYDIIKGKITAKDVQYSDMYNIMSNMSEESFVVYQNYMQEVYTALRYQELGIDYEIPKLDAELTRLDGTLFTQTQINKITYEALMAH